MKATNLYATESFMDVIAKLKAGKFFKTLVGRNWLIPYLLAGLLVGGFLRDVSVVLFFASLAMSALFFLFGVRALSTSLTAYSQNEIGDGSRKNKNLLDSFGEFLHRGAVRGKSLDVGGEVLCGAGSIIPADGKIIQGLALVDESAITGESAPVLRDTETQRNLVNEGTLVLTNEIRIRILRLPRRGKIAKVRALIADPQAQDFDLEASPESDLGPRLPRLLLFSLVIGTVTFTALHSPQAFLLVWILSGVALVPIWVFAKLQTELGKAFIDLAIHRNLLPRSIETMERAGKIQTIAVSEIPTAVNDTVEIVRELVPAAGFSMEHLAKAAQLACLCDETGPSRAVVTFVKSHFGFLAQSLSKKKITFFTSSPEQLSGINISSVEGEEGMRSILVGRLENIRKHVESLGGHVPEEIQNKCGLISASGESSMVVCEGRAVLGVVHFFGSQRSAIVSTFGSLKKYGFEIVSLATEKSPASFDSERKLIQIKMLQNQGKKVAFIGQYPSDRKSLLQADLSLVAAENMEQLMPLSEVTNVRGDHLQFKHLFRLGKNLLYHRRVLLWLGTGSFLATFLFSIASGLRLGFSQLSAREFLDGEKLNFPAFFSLTSATLACGVLIMYALIGVHDQRGRLHRLALSIFSLPWGVIESLLFIFFMGMAFRTTIRLAMKMI